MSRLFFGAKRSPSQGAPAPRRHAGRSEGLHEFGGKVVVAGRFWRRSLIHDGRSEPQDHAQVVVMLRLPTGPKPFERPALHLPPA